MRLGTYAWRRTRTSPRRPMRVRGAARYGQVVRWRSLADRVRRVDPRLIDVGLTAGAVILGVGSQLVAIQHDELYRGTDALAVLLGLITTLPVFWRRRYPLGALLVSSAAVTVLAVLEYRLNTLPIIVLFLMYAAAAHEPLRRALVALGAVSLALVVIWLSGAPDFDAAGMGSEMALFAGTWLGGVAMRSRGATAVARLAEAEERG